MKVGSGKYKVGIYVRESRDDNEENYETIETQRDLLVDYVQREKLGETCRIYVDDNTSGSGFDRKGIELLRDDVVSYRIDMLVLKDLSRLGRNNAKTLLFLDFLEEHGVRVVTFDGRYDSLKDSDTVGIETWFNERYIKDISRKIRANLRFKIERGEYIGSAPYGYNKSSKEKNRLCIDEETAFIVKEIFRLYRSGYGYKRIADMMDSKDYPPPSCRYAAGSASLHAAKWNAVAVKRILCNRVYVGDTVQGVSEKISFKSKKTRRLPESRWIVTKDTHQQIIGREEFEEVQKIRTGKKKFAGANKGRLHKLRGILFCGGCGSAMYARVRKNRPDGYICGSYSRNGKAACTSHYVNEQSVIEIITVEIMNLLKNRDMVARVKNLLQEHLPGEDDGGRRMESLMKQLAMKQKQQDCLYMDKLEGKISESLFLRINTDIEKRISFIAREMEKAGKTKTAAVNMDDVVCNMMADIAENGITGEMISTIVERVTVFDAGDAGLEKGTIVIDFKPNKV